jgi:hypothetical protein
MAIAHLCVNCGLDLARVNPRREPIYGLAIVSCPRCAVVAVRRLHPLRKWLRLAIRLDAALVALLIQISLLVALTALWMHAVVGLASLLTTERWIDFAREQPGSLVADVLVIPLLVGAWLTAGLSHWRRVLAWGGWLAWIAGWLAITMIEPTYRPLSFGTVPELFKLNWTTFTQALLAEWLLPVGITALLLVIATTGIPLGYAALRVASAFRSWRWRWRRRRRRLGKLVL